MKRSSTASDAESPTVPLVFQKKHIFKIPRQLAVPPAALIAKCDQMTVENTQQNDLLKKQTEGVREPSKSSLSLLDVLLPTDKPPVMMSNPGNTKKMEVVAREDVHETTVAEQSLSPCDFVPQPDTAAIKPQKRRKFGEKCNRILEPPRLLEQCVLSLTSRNEQQVLCGGEQMKNDVPVQSDLRTRALAIFGNLGFSSVGQSNSVSESPLLTTKQLTANPI